MIDRAWDVPTGGEMVHDREVRSFFFRAMVAGYASGAKPEPVPDMPGFKQLVHKESHFSLLDRWCGGAENGLSSGTTTIWAKETTTEVWRPVWVMHYSGQYMDSAIPTLRAALHSVYKQKIFRGGRGPEIFRRGEHVYVNCLERGDFASFAGREEIFGASSLGYHEYSGQSLLL